jgi:hypothetical protein
MAGEKATGVVENFSPTGQEVVDAILSTSASTTVNGAAPDALIPRSAIGPVGAQHRQSMARQRETGHSLLKSYTVVTSTASYRGKLQVIEHSAVYLEI